MAAYIWRCDLSKQYGRYKSAIDEAAVRVLKRGVYTLGREVALFEKEFAKYVGRAYGVGVGSGTDALMLALKVSGIRPGDEVITSTYAPTPVATAIALAGGVPVFADIEEESCCIDPEAVRKSLSRRTRFIVPVHLFGNVCDMPAIREVMKDRRITIVEDAAQAHGSMLGGKKAGALGDISCFSFYPTKNLGACGDGGMVMTDSKVAADRLRLLRNYGKKSNPFDSEILGYNSRLDELQASILRVKLRFLDQMNAERASLVGLYKEGLRGTPISFLEGYDNTKANYHILTVIVERDRDGLIRFLERRDIQTNVYYPRPLHSMNAFRQYLKKGQTLPASERMSRRALALPLYPEMKKSAVLFVIDGIQKHYSKKNQRYG